MSVQKRLSSSNGSLGGREGVKKGLVRGVPMSQKMGERAQFSFFSVLLGVRNG